MTKRVFIPICAIALVLSMSFAALADTIRLKDGSVIRGEVVGFKDQQFTVLVGGGARGRRSTLTLYVEDVESIEFDAGTGAASSAGANDDDNGTTGGSGQPSTQTSTQLPGPAPSHPTNQSSSTTQPPAARTNTTPTTTTPSTSSKPVSIQINTRVRGDNTSNGWTNTGLVVRRGQHLRITAMGQVSLGNARFSTPAGISTLPDKDKLMQDEATGALICVVGDDNNDFIFIGRARDFVAQRDGVLFLGINEGNLSDNTGAYDAVIEAEVVGAGH